MFYCNNDLLELHDLTFIEEEEETCENQAKKINESQISSCQISTLMLILE